MTIRQTPTLAECAECFAPMAAVRGPFSSSIGRARAPMGYRRGYIRFKDGKDWPICEECVAFSLPSSVQEGRGES